MYAPSIKQELRDRLTRILTAKDAAYRDSEASKLMRRIKEAWFVDKKAYKKHQDQYW